MNRFRTASLLSGRHYLLIVFFMCAAVTGIVSGCATSEQVKEIVESSNASLLTASLMGAGADHAPIPVPGLGTESGARAQEPWMVQSAKIDEFIETHPDQKVTASALRMRQAMLLLAYKQYNLANAAFNMVEQPLLYSARDKAQYNLRTHIVWWYRASDSEVLSLKDLEKADKALGAFQTEIAQLGDSPGIRDYLAEMRAWIAMVSARSMTNKNKAREYLEDGINMYSAIFTDKDTKALKNNSAPSTWDVSMEVLRRRLRARAVINYAREVIIEQGIEPEFQSDTFAELIRRGS